MRELLMMEMMMMMLEEMMMIIIIMMMKKTNLWMELRESLLLRAVIQSDVGVTSFFQCIDDHAL